jgi:hypothetical protein
VPAGFTEEHVLLLEFILESFFFGTIFCPRPGLLHLCDPGLDIYHSFSMKNIFICLFSNLYMYPILDFPGQVYLYDPGLEQRVVGLLQTGAVMGRLFASFESHIPYLLQFLIDYNIYGMNMVSASAVQFRGPFARDAELATPPPVSSHTQGGQKVAGVRVGLVLVWIGSSGEGHVGSKQVEYLVPNWFQMKIEILLATKQ